MLSRSAHPLHPPGGMERAVFQLARYLNRAGVETVLFTRPPTRPGDFPGEVVSVAYGGLPGGRHGRVLDRSLNYPAFSSRLGRAVAEGVRSGRIDVVDAQGLTALGYGRLRRRERGLSAPLVMNPQGMEEHKTRGLKRLALGRLRSLSREAAGLADRVIATDSATRAEVPVLLRVPASKVVLLPNGVDAGEIRALTPGDPAGAVAAAFPELRDADPLLLSVGRLEPYKGFREVAAALAGLAAAGRLPAGWAWAVVGEGPDRPYLLRRAAALDGRARLLGHVGETLLHALYARADLFVHATRFEGSSLVTLEAMAHGLAVLATRAGGIPDKVIDGETGRLVAPGDGRALEQALAELAADPHERRRLGARARRRVEDEFCWPVIARRAVALYEELLRERPA